jgi:hypothetical protein
MCREQEKKLGEDFAYIRDNAPELLLSGILSLLFSSEKKTDTAANGRSKRDELTDPFIASDYLAIARSLLPVVRSIIQPMLITWGINKAISLISGLFSGNKKVSSRN